MFINCYDLCTNIPNITILFCESAGQVLTTTVIKLDQTIRDPEAFQKICIVVRTIIQGLNSYWRTNYLPKLIKALDVTESFDFYGFCRLPSYFFNPYTAERMDEYVILDQLEVILCINWQKGFPDEKNQNRDPFVHQFAKSQLTAFLKQMVKNDQDLHSEEEVKELLYNWLTQILLKDPVNGYVPEQIDLKNLSIPLKKASWLEIITDTTFVMIDIACVPVFLQEWSLIDLSFYASQLSSFPFLSWILNQSLDDCVWGAMCVGFLLQFIQAFLSLEQGKLIAEEVGDAKWLMAASIAECLYSLVFLQRKDPRLIIFLAFTAKFLGLCRFWFAPEPSFFTKNEDAL